MGRKDEGLRVVLATVLAVALAAPSAVTAVPAPGPEVRVIVRGLPGAGVRVADAVDGVGGEVLSNLPILDGVVALVPVGRIEALRGTGGVAAVSEDRTVEFLDDDDDDDSWAEDHQTDGDFGSMLNVTRAIGAHDVWSDGILGQGVGIALIDTGVVPVEGLNTPGKIVNGPDLSFDSQLDNLRYLDGYGHGTHMAGIMAGLDSRFPDDDEAASTFFAGVAPRAHVVSVKVGAADGAVDVSQIIAAIDWVVEHRNDPGVNIRVLNLSFGTDSTQDHRLDPLSYAAEVAWRKGIVVVASAGNSGFGTPRLNDPAVNPYVIAVGAADLNGTYRADNDVIPDFSTRGDASRRVDLVAPGQSIISLRNPGSVADVDHPTARVGERFFRGSGTSQAAAVVSGAAALLISQRPSLRPDQVKRLLTSSAAPMPAADPAGRGAGLLNVSRAAERSVPSHTQSHGYGTGTGSLGAARGTQFVSDGGSELHGEQDIFGQPWRGDVWSANALGETAWSSATTWMGHELVGDCWCGTSFAARTWAARSWQEHNWAARSWQDSAWAARSWHDGTWSGGDWAGDGWTARSWQGLGWSTARYGS